MDNNKLINKCFIKIIKVLIILGIIIWSVFSITALANENNYEIKKKCSKSNLWSVLITVLLITIILVTHLITYDTLVNKYNYNNINKKFIFILINILFVLLVWSCIELYNPCSRSNLINLTLYTCLVVWFYLNLSIFILLIISVIAFGIYLYYDKIKSDSNNYIIEDNVEFNNEFNSPWDMAVKSNNGYVTI